MIIIIIISGINITIIIVIIIIIIIFIIIIILDCSSCLKNTSSPESLISLWQNVWQPHLNSGQFTYF